MGGLLWRSSKADVAEELGLPPQRHHLDRLQLNAIERHFYRSQHKVSFVLGWEWGWGVCACANTSCKTSCFQKHVRLLVCSPGSLPAGLC